MPPSPQPTATPEAAAVFSETSAASADAPSEVAVPAPLPAWVAPYLASLRSCFHKPEAARAAGIDPVTVVELRETHPEFAAHERRIMTAYADLLEAEALRRVTTLPTPGPDGKFLRPLGSDRLLLRLMEHYIPGFAPAKKSATTSSPTRKSTTPENGAATSASSSTAPEDLGALQKQITLLSGEISHHKFHRKDLERRLAESVADCQRASRQQQNTFYRNLDLKAALAEAGLPIPPYRTPEFRPPAPAELISDSAESIESTVSSVSSVLSASSAQSAVTPPYLPTAPSVPSVPTESAKSTPPPAHPSDEFLAREQAKLQAALAQLTAQLQSLKKAGLTDAYQPVRNIRARILQLQSCAIPIGEGLTFAQALAQSTPRILRPP